MVTPAEYKTVQDIRYSGGIRIFEILSRTGEHLTYSLDEEGQDLVFLMMYGYTPASALAREAAAIQELPAGSEERLRRQKMLDRQRRVARRLAQVYSLDERRDAASIAQLAAKFPPTVPPADIRLVSSTMASTQDVFYYTDDTQLTQIADRALQLLSDTGLAEGEMRANAQVHGGDLARWTGIRELPERERNALLTSSITYRVGTDTFEVPLRGAVHALVLKLLGPARIYQEAVQGADVLNTSIAFPELLELVDDPPKLVALMLEGNARSALAITDGISGRGSRMMTYRDIMLFLATCDALAGPGRGSYRAIGLGDHVVARLRAEMSAKRQRAAELLQALEAVDAAAPGPALAEASREARRVWRRVLEQVAGADEALEATAEEERSRRYRRVKPRDRIITDTLTRVASGLDLAQLDFAAWLALGGAYLVVGRPAEEIESRRARLERGVARIEPLPGLPPPRRCFRRPRRRRCRPWSGPASCPRSASSSRCWAGRARPRRSTPARPRPASAGAPCAPASSASRPSRSARRASARPRARRAASIWRRRTSARWPSWSRSWTNPPGCWGRRAGIARRSGPRSTSAWAGSWPTRARG